MSYSSYRRLPAVIDYTHASSLLSKARAIRNLAPTTYPLGERRYHYNFSIRKVGDQESRPTTSYYAQAPGAQDGDIELLLYKTPVVTLHQDGTLTIFQGKHYCWSAADCKFIEEVLYRYVSCAYTNLGRLVVELNHNDESTGKEAKRAKLILNRDQHARLKIVNTDTLRTLMPTEETAEAVQHTVIRLNRAATNNVRKRYGEFYRYMKGMIGVRKYEYEYDYPWKKNSDDPIVYYVDFSPEEVTGVVPTVDPVNPEGNTMIFKTPTVYVPEYLHNSPTKKPPKIVNKGEYSHALGKYVQYDSTEPYYLWLANTEVFLDLCRTPADAEDQHEKFRQAFVWLAFYCKAPSVSTEKVLSVPVTKLTATMDEIIFKYHSEEVFERVPVKPGSIPSTKYNAWVTRERA